MRNFLISRVAAFKYAFQGWGYALRTQRNSWIHAVATLAVILMAAWLRLDARDWALLVFAIGLVWAAEFFNTALEALVDLASPGLHPLAKSAKDVGAAAVLVAALVAVLVGLLILGPPLLTRIY